MIEQYFAELTEAFEKNADPVKAAGAKAYMRNKSEFYGIPSPVRRQLVKEFIVKWGLPRYDQLEELVYFAWEQPQREWQYTAIEITERFVKNADKELLDISEWMITNKSWWDTVDFVAPNIAGMLFKKFPEVKSDYIENWMLSGNLWARA